MIKTFVKSNWWVFLLGVVIVWGMIVGYNVLRDFLFNAGMAAAKVEYDQLQADAEARLVAKNAEYVALIGEAERQRQEVKAQHEAEIRKYKNDIGYFKSETAEALKAKEATAAQWFVAKQLDEISIGLRDERIEEQDAQIVKLTEDWRLSDIAKDAAHKAVVDELVFRFAKCQEWTQVLEAKAKKKPFAKILQLAVVGAAFVLGRRSK